MILFLMNLQPPLDATYQKYYFSSNTEYYNFTSLTDRYFFEAANEAIDMTDEVVFKGADNSNSITITDSDGNAVDLTSVIRMKLTFDDEDQTEVDVSLGDSPALIDWASTAGIVTFYLNDLTLAEGRYRATLKAYDGVNTDGIVYFHIDRDDLRFFFIDE